jgi:hypothetical protein
MKRFWKSFCKHSLPAWISFLFAGFLQANAQPCESHEDMLSKQGGWKKTQDFLEPGKNYSPEMKPEVFKREDQIQQVIYNAYPEPKGMQANWYHQIYGQPHFNSAPLRYELSIYLMELYCDPSTHTVKPSDETSNIMNVYVNHFDQFMKYDTFLRVGKLPVWYMPHRVGQLSGVDLYEFSSVRINQRAILVTRESQTPVTPVTRNQYLLALKDLLQKQYSQSLAVSLKAAKDDKQKEQAKLYEELEYGPRIKIIDDWLSLHSVTELNQPALVREFQKFTRFYTEEEGGFMAVVLNLGYFTRNQKLYFPQFMIVMWKWNDREGPGGGLLRPRPPDMDSCCRIAKYYKERIEKNLDVRSLRQMLDK